MARLAIIPLTCLRRLEGIRFVEAGFAEGYDYLELEFFCFRDAEIYLYKLDQSNL